MRGACRERGREGGREGGRERGREGEREGGRERQRQRINKMIYLYFYLLHSVSLCLSLIGNIMVNTSQLTGHSGAVFCVDINDTATEACTASGDKVLYTTCSCTILVYTSFSFPLSLSRLLEYGPLQNLIHSVLGVLR